MAVEKIAGLAARCWNSRPFTSHSTAEGEPPASMALSSVRAADDTLADRTTTVGFKPLTDHPGAM